MMRRSGRWASLGFCAFMAVVGCGGDDEAPPGGTSGAGGTSGRGGAAGTDAGRADNNTGGAGTGGAAGSAGSAGSGASDAGMDSRLDGRAGSGGTPEAGPDNPPIVDARTDPDAGITVDSALDQASADADATSDVGNDGPATSDADAADGQSADAADVASGDASAGDTSDGGDVASGDASDASDAASLDVFDAPSCDDGKAATYDFYHPTYGCGHKYDANPGDSDAWITYDAGFHVDVATGLGWAFPAGSRSQSAAATACDGFSVAGLTSWRMATIDEARSLAGGCAKTASGGSCPLSDPSCLNQSCGIASPACDSCFAGQGPHSGEYCKVDVAVCTFFHTSSSCSNCSDASATDWIYIPINGNFYPYSSATAIPTACVSVVPDGVPAADGG